MVSGEKWRGLSGKSGGDCLFLCCWIWVLGGVVCEGSCQVLADGGRRAVGGLYSSWLAAVGYLLGAAWWGPSWDCGNCGIAMVEGPPKISQVKYGESSGNQAF